MFAGVPGTGLGGIFYLLSALAMPAGELVVTLQGRSSRARWKEVLFQFILAAGIIAGFWITGWLLALIMPHGAGMEKIAINPATHNILKIKPFFITGGVLFTVLVLIECLHLVFKKK